MAPTDVELTICKARNVKNVNWKHGDLRAYAVAYVDEDNKLSTRVDEVGDIDPSWEQTIVIPVSKPLEDARLTIEIFHDKAEKPEKAIVGSVSLPLMEAMDAGGFDETLDYNLKLKRPSGRPHGEIEFSVRLRERRAPAYAAPPPPGAAYGTGYRGDWQQSSPYPAPAYGASPYPAQPYPQGYPTPAYAAAQPYPNYGAYGSQQPAYYDQSGYGYGSSGYGGQAPPQEQKTSKFGGIGTGLAVGALAGAVGGLALGEYIDHERDEAADEQAEEDAERYGGGDDDYGDDF